MDSTEQKNNDMTKKNHACPPNGHCCECEGCGSMCMRGTMMHGMKKYWVRHFIVLILGVIASFYVGMKLGEIKGYLMASYGGRPMQGQRFMMGRDDQWGDRTQTPPPTTQTLPLTQ
jgi:hypothetical protein